MLSLGQHLSSRETRLSLRLYNEKEEDKAPERDPKWTMLKDEMKAVFDNLMMGAGRRAE